MPEVGNHYIGAEILLPRGDKMARGHVVACSHDASGNVPILNIKMYQVEFAGGKITEFTTNVIA